VKRLDGPKIVVDEQSARIILSTMGRSRSVIELSRSCGIPIAMCCYRVRVLVKEGMLRITGYSEKGRLLPLYHADLFHPYVFREKESIRASFRLIDVESEFWAADPSIVR
jgi:hypothetical protein